MFKDLARLFENQKRVKLLKFFLFQPEFRGTAFQAGKTIGITKQSAEREVRALTRMQILTSRKQKKNTLYALNKEYQHVDALRTFLEATTLPDDRAILAAFHDVPGVSLLIATGTLANEERSSLDLMVVARNSKNPTIRRAVYKVECLTGLPLRYAVLDPTAYAERFEARDRLIRDVLEFKNRRIIGHL